MLSGSAPAERPPARLARCVLQKHDGSGANARRFDGHRCAPHHVAETTVDTDNDFCRLQSIHGAEPIAGSAVSATTLVVALEHDGAWGAKAVEESDLPAAAKARLRAWEDDVPGTRVQLVRRGRSAGPRTLMLACTELGRARVVQMPLAEPDDLVALDLPALATALRTGAVVPGAQEVTRPQLLVCTNGRRDRCCAKWGVPVYRALEPAAEVDVWQTTHLGGHRFAATLLWLPHGICLGRVELEEVDELLVALERGEIHRIDRLRGRVSLDSVAQAAESEWRLRQGEHRVDALRAVEVDALGEDEWNVRVRDRAGSVHPLHVRRVATGATAQPSCGKPAAPIYAWRFDH